MEIVFIVSMVLGIPSFLLAAAAVVVKLRAWRRRQREADLYKLAGALSGEVYKMIHKVVDPIRRELLPNGGNSLTDRVARIDGIVQAHSQRFNNLDARLNTIDERLTETPERVVKPNS